MGKLFFIAFVFCSLFSKAQIKHLIYIDASELDELNSLNAVIDKSSALMDSLNASDEAFVLFISNDLSLITVDNNGDYKKVVGDLLDISPGLPIPSADIEKIMKHLQDIELAESLHYYVFSSTYALELQDQDETLIERLAQIYSETDFSQHDALANITIYIATNDFLANSEAYEALRLNYKSSVIKY